VRSYPRPRLALDRFAGAFTPERLVVVLTKAEMLRYESSLAGLPYARRLVQPEWRGSAAEILLAALSVVAEDPDAILTMLPAARLGHHEAGLIEAIAIATAAVEMRPGLPIVIGGNADRFDAGPWIEAGAFVPDLEHLAIRSVLRVMPHAPLGETARDSAAEVFAALAVVVRAEMLVTLGRHVAPDVIETLEPLADVIGRPEEGLLSDAFWEGLPHAGLATDVLRRSAVLPIPDAIFDDRTDPAVPLAA
jgi:mannose-1-phosphate guanylyltransferase